MRNRCGGRGGRVERRGRSVTQVTRRLAGRSRWLVAPSRWLAGCSRQLAWRSWRAGPNPPVADPAHGFHQGADDERSPERQQEACPRPPLERRAAHSSEEIGVARPDGAGESRSQDEAPTVVADDSAGQCHRSAAARDEPAHHDEARPELVEGPQRPFSPVLTLLAAEELAFSERAEAPADEIREV